MVALPPWEMALSVDYGGHSALTVDMEGDNELAHRGVMPADLGHTILNASHLVSHVAPAGSHTEDDSLSDVEN